MAITHLLRQMITITPAASKDKYGKPTFGAPVTVKARFQSTARSIMTAQNERLPIDGIVFLKAGTAAEIGDKITFGGANYKVMSKMPAIDGRGRTHHLELMVQRWAI